MMQTFLMRPHDACVRLFSLTVKFFQLRIDHDSIVTTLTSIVIALPKLRVLLSRLLSVPYNCQTVKSKK